MFIPGDSLSGPHCFNFPDLFKASVIPREDVCKALIVTERVVRKWINCKKRRPGRTALLKGDKAKKLSKLIEQPETADRTFWTAKAFHGYIGETCQVECSYQTVVRFFHNQGFALKVPQPCPDRLTRYFFMSDMGEFVKECRFFRCCQGDLRSFGRVVSKIPVITRNGFYGNPPFTCLFNERKLWKFNVLVIQFLPVCIFISPSVSSALKTGAGLKNAGTSVSSSVFL